MIGNTIKLLLGEKAMTVSELAKATAIPSTTLYSMIKRDNSTVDLKDFLKICNALSVPPEFFFDRLDGGDPPLRLPSSAELELIARWRSLDAHGRRLIELVTEAELERVSLEEGQPVEAESESRKIIPLFSTPAAAGYASPAFGEDYEDYEVPVDSKADFAARIQGDSMEPYIEDGSIVLVTRTLNLRDGDVGLFCVDNDMYCKQYCEDMMGNVYLFSLNRERSDADIEISYDSGRSVFCYGRVLLKDRPRLPVL